MNIQELKLKSSEQLITQAEELGIENASTLRKQEILFAILKKVAEKEEPLIIAIPETLEEHWSKFVQTFPASQRVAIENATFRLEGTILIATISTGAPLSSFEEIQFSFASFTRINPCGAITQVAFEKGIIVHDDSKPYTDAEKVEYLRQKHPLLKQMMDDWKLH